MTVTPTASDSSATIAVNGNTVTSGIGYILTSLIAGEPTTVTVIVTAQDSTTKTSPFHSYSYVLPGLYDKTLHHDHFGTERSFPALTDVTAAQLCHPAPPLPATSATDNSQRQHRDQRHWLHPHQPDCGRVTAQDSTTKTYTITLTRAAALSDNADLTGLTISSGTLSPQLCHPGDSHPHCQRQLGYNNSDPSRILPAWPTLSPR